MDRNIQGSDWDLLRTCTINIVKHLNYIFTIFKTELMRIYIVYISYFRFSMLLL